MTENTRDKQIPTTLVIGGREVDGRTLTARRYRDLCAELASDAGGDPSSAQWLLICRAAGLTVQLELLEARIVQGEQIETAEYASLSNVLIRLLNTLGLNRKAKDVSPAILTIDAHARAVKDADA